MRVVLTVLAVVVVVSPCRASTCNCPGAHLPLEQRGCSPPSGCRGGQVMDPCYCCLTCAKVVGETCGEEGRCDFGLYCHPRPLQEGGSDPTIRGVCTGLPTTPRQSYGGPVYHRNPYTLYPSLQTTPYYNRQPAWGGYPVGSAATTQRYPGQNYQPGVQPSPAYPGQNYQPGVQPSPAYSGQNYQPGVQPSPAYPGQNYQPGVQPSPAYSGQNYQPGVQPSPAYPGQNYQPGVQPSPASPGQNYQPGVQPSPAYPGQNYQPGAQTSTSYPRQNYQPGAQTGTTENSGGSHGPTYNWQNFYPSQGQQTTARYPRQM